MATPEDHCCMCLLDGRRVPSIRWEGVPICQSCFDAQRAARNAAKNQPSKIVTIGTRDAAELYAAHCERQVFQGAHPEMIGLGAIIRPPDKALH